MNIALVGGFLELVLLTEETIEILIFWFSAKYCHINVQCFWISYFKGMFFAFSEFGFLFQDLKVKGPKDSKEQPTSVTMEGTDHSTTCLISRLYFPAYCSCFIILSCDHHFSLCV